MSKPAAAALDVAVIGGGVMGCAIALRLAQRGVRVTVIERGIPGAEASSAAAGILGPQWESDGPGAMFDLGLRSRAMYPAFADELRTLTGIDVGHTASGLIELALSDGDADALVERRAWQTARGLSAELLEPPALRRLEPAMGDDVRAGLRFPDEAHVSARALARALSQGAAIAGARFLQGRYVRRVIVEGDRATGVELDGERLAAGTIVLAAGSWSGLVDGAGVPAAAVRPARGQMVAIETRPPLFRHVLAPYGRGYLVPRADGVALAGSTLEMVGFRKEVTVGGLAQILAMARVVLPALSDLPIVETWSNFRPYTPDRMPVLGPSGIEGLMLATGHHRYGILLTPVTAEILADLVTNGRSAVDLAPFAAARFA